VNDEYEADLLREVMSIISMLDARKDPEYEAGMRRTVPSAQQAHATRVPEIRKVVSEWLKAHKGVPVSDLMMICEMLWSTGWREERIVAIALAKRHRDAIDEIDWDLIKRWSAAIDNWEHVDHLAELSATLLQRQPRLINRVEQLATSYNPWQRRLALVTMIVAGRDFAWREALRRFTERMSHDDEPAVKKAVTWARRELRQREGSLV
jgi:3-methyladenine DNA glycosylase AlkD